MTDPTHFPLNSVLTCYKVSKSSIKRSPQIILPPHRSFSPHHFWSSWRLIPPPFTSSSRGFAKEAQVMKEIRAVSESVKKRDYSKLKVSADMVDYAMATYGNKWDIGDDIADVILEDLWEKYENKESQKDTNVKGNQVDVIIISDTSDDECGNMSSKTTNSKGSSSQASKASKASAPKVVLGLVAAVGCSGTNRNEWYVPPPKDLKSPPMNNKPPIKNFTCYF